MQSAVQVPASFLVNRNPISPGFGEVRNELVWILNHEVAVERQLCGLAQRTHHRRSDGQVGNEMSVHNIDMDDTSSAFARGAHFLRQTCKVSR